MAMELDKEKRKQATESIERYFTEHMADYAGGRLGNVEAASLLNFFLEEIGPSIYNRAVADVQERIQQRVMEVDIEIHKDEFGFWKQNRRKR